MLWNGQLFKEVELGNSWHVYSSPQKNGWLVGYSASSEHRLIPKGTKAEDVALKWYEHDPAESSTLGKAKPTSVGRSVSILTNAGRFEVKFWKDDPTAVLTVILTEPGDFVAWGSGLNHEWKCISPSTVLTMRWTPVE